MHAVVLKFRTNIYVFSIVARTSVTIQSQSVKHHCHLKPYLAILYLDKFSQLNF